MSQRLEEETRQAREALAEARALASQGAETPPEAVSAPMIRDGSHATEELADVASGEAADSVPTPQIASPPPAPLTASPAGTSTAEPPALGGPAAATVAAEAAAGEAREGLLALPREALPPPAPLPPVSSEALSASAPTASTPPSAPAPSPAATAEAADERFASLRKSYTDRLASMAQVFRELPLRLTADGPLTSLRMCDAPAEDQRERVSDHRVCFARATS